MSGLLIRHTRVAIPQGLCYGRTDVPLAESFEREAATVRASLPWTPLAVWSSPAERCRRLAARLAAGEVRIEPRLAELDMGEWDGRKWDELSGPVHEAWKADPWGTRPPGGESAEDLVARVRVLRAEVMATRPERLVLVTHAGVIRAWRSIGEGRQLAELFAEPIGFGSLTRLSR
ncbi:MAG TPA: alpha-ribazole phosphatase family protein [Opitutaceae bacterium]|nr:alpha-ribazole phosphatase family protein [Opitutaceae bacterium]